MAEDHPKNLLETKRIMGVLGRMPPKLHSEMKLGKPRAKPKKSPARKRITKKRDR
jgi:hypothetical protein